MPIVVEAKAPADYQAWLAARQKAAAANLEDPNKVWPLAELMARGEKVYTQNCVACHQQIVDGINTHPGDPQKMLDCLHCHREVGHGPLK